MWLENLILLVAERKVILNLISKHMLQNYMHLSSILLQCNITIFNIDVVCFCFSYHTICHINKNWYTQEHITWICEGFSGQRSLAFWGKTDIAVLTGHIFSKNSMKVENVRFWIFFLWKRQKAIKLKKKSMFVNKIRTKSFFFTFSWIIYKMKNNLSLQTNVV